MRYGDPTLRDRLAGEYVLGTLHGRARQRFERLLGKDAGLRSTVAEWEDRLHPLAEALPPIEPPERVWKQVQLRLGMRAARPRLWERLDFWRPLALASSALAAALLIYVGVISRPPLPAPSQEIAYVSVLSDKEARPVWVASATASGQVVLRAVAPQTVPADRALELWVIPGEGQAPRSLGLLPPGGSRAMTLPEALRQVIEPSAALSISLEPTGGSPTGLPTGPVLYQGAWVSTGVGASS